MLVPVAFFFLFPEVKISWNGKIFDDVITVEKTSMEQFLVMPKTVRGLSPPLAGTVDQVCM
jgi:hypothetical protein